MDKMYKAEVTEKEAQNLGAHRWEAKNKRHYFIRSLIALGVAVVFAVLAFCFTNTGASLVFGFLTGMAVLVSIFFVYRLDELATKNGKEFAQSLKEEK